MKTIKSIISLALILYASFNSYCQVDEFVYAFRADSVSYGIYDSSKRVYDFTDLMPDTTSFVFQKDILYATGERFKGFEQYKYRDDSCDYYVRRLRDENGKTCFSVFACRRSDYMTWLEFRYPRLILRFNIKPVDM